uniref:Uncharacterized protein n=1 Tax=Arundo donax TaxID=35708 RepID=A0A0A9F276_ARUDO
MLLLLVLQQIQIKLLCNCHCLGWAAIHVLFCSFLRLIYQSYVIGLGSM